MWSLKLDVSFVITAAWLESGGDDSRGVRGNALNVLESGQRDTETLDIWNLNGSDELSGSVCGRVGKDSRHPERSWSTIC